MRYVMYSLFLLLLIAILFSVYVTTIQPHLTKSIFDKNKETVTETHIVSYDEYLDTLHQQMKLTQKLESTRKYALIGEEMRKGLDEAFLAEEIMYKTPDYKSFNIEYPVTNYENGDKTIKFISGNVRIKKVQSEDGEWKSFKSVSH